MTVQKIKYCQNFENPDETRTFQSRGHLDLIQFSDECSIGRGVFEPGWRWSVDVKPIAGTSSCEAEHVGYCLSGSMIIKMNSGEEFQIQAGDSFHILAGHDAWVDSDQPCVMIDFTGFKNYAKPISAAA